MKPPLPSVATAPRTLPVALIDRCPLNPRIVSEADAADIGRSLRDKGQAVRIEVRPSPHQPGRFELVDGERRWRGARREKLDTLEANVGDWTDEQVLQFIWITGTESRRLSVLEEAKWARTALDTTHGATLESVGALIGVEPTLLNKRLCLLDLDAPTQEAVQLGKLPWTTAHALAMVPTETARSAACKRCIHPDDVEGPLSYRDTVEMIRRDYARTLKGLPWALDDAFPEIEGAGPCSSCRYRVGNNPEEYGQMKLKGSDWCMRPECFAKKEAAVRGRVAAKEAGKVPLAPEVNALVFAAGSAEPRPASGYAIVNRPIPPDLVKDEVAANRAPTFAEVSPAAPVYVATDGTGRCVDVVKVDEAVAGTSEPAIFRAEVIARYGIRKNDQAQTHEASDGSTVTTPSLSAAAPAAGSIAAEQKRQKSAENAAEKSKAKKLRACAEWMLELHGALTAQVKPESYGYTLASLRWEHVLLSVADEDALLVLRALTEDAPAKGQTAKSCLAEFVAGIGGAEELQAVVDLMMIAPALRAQGTEAKWVAEWHRHLVLPIADRVPDACVSAPPPAMDAVEQEKLNAIAKAHAAKMPPEEIARSFGLTVPEVCGMLQIPLPGEATPTAPASSAPALDELDAAIAELVPGSTASARVAMLACYIKRVVGKIIPEGELTPEQRRKIAEILATAKAGKSAAKTSAAVRTASEGSDQ
jgi:ParB/RepB/Spo0J family partition protein